MTDAYPWNDPAKKIEAAAYCRWVFDGLFPQLAEALNQAHAELHSPRYWRVLVGPWLIHHIMARYEKYVDPKCEFKTLEPIWMKDRPRGLVGKLRDAYASALDFVGRTRPILLCDLHMRHQDMWRIAWETRFRAWPIVRRTGATSGGEEDEHKRPGLRQFKFEWGRDEFENVVIESLAEALPDVYVERYRSVRDEALRFAGGRQKVLVSGPGWKSNERLKFIGALAAERGAKLIGAQHGGNTGWGAVHPMEDFALAGTDGFITWGIQPEGWRVTPLPDPGMQRLMEAKPRPPAKDAPILFAGTSYARYASAGIRTQPMAVQVMDYMEWQNRFFRAVGDLRKDFWVRTYPADYGWMNKVRLLQEFPGLNLDTFDRGVMYHLRRCKLAVIDNPQTTFLEAMAMGKPCVLYFDPALWKMRTEAEAHFRALAGAGMVHFTPEEAAEHVRKVAADPKAWWDSPDVRHARTAFLRWALMWDPQWPKAWAVALEEWANE